MAEGFIYYDLFNQIIGANMVKLISPLIPVNEDPQLCFSFWYAAFGAGESAIMQISKRDNTTSDEEAEKVRIDEKGVENELIFVKSSRAPTSLNNN